MSESRPHPLQELAAGYVLGDLDPEELLLFQQRLAQEPTLQAEVQALQETLGALPYGLPVAQPAAQVRSQLLEAVTVPNRPSNPRKPWAWGLGGLALGIALMLGGQQWSMRYTIVQAPTQSPDTAEIIHTSAQFVAINWQDLNEVVTDHVQSLNRPQGPVDLATQQLLDIRAEYIDQMALPQRLPYLQAAKLVGGSFCQLNQTKGLRFTYLTPSGQTVSFYQLAQSADISLPQLSPERLYLDLEPGPNVALWRDQSFIYVLAAPLPIQGMQELVIQSEPVLPTS